MISSARQIVETYIQAKDRNEPFLMEHAFAPDATLKMVVNAGTISFPPLSNGLQSISDVLVRRFAQTYENVRTFCLALPPRPDAQSFSCEWLVGMSEKTDGKVRIGCGSYDWYFRSVSPRLADRLTITIELMESLPPACLTPILRWLSQLTYPWCTPQAALSEAPELQALQPILHHLRRASQRVA